MSDGLPGWFTVLTDADHERMMRDKYEPILTADDYALLRERCGMPPVIDGEVVDERTPGRLTHGALLRNFPGMIPSA